MKHRISFSLLVKQIATASSDKLKDTINLNNLKSFHGQLTRVPTSFFADVGTKKEKLL